MTNKSKKNITGGSWRIYLLALVLLGLAGVIIFRLYSLQVKAHETYSAIAEDQHYIFQELIPKRGEIYLKEGENDVYALAVNREYQMAYAVPKEIKDEEREDLINNVSEILGVDRNVISQKFSDKEDVYEVLKHKLTDEEIDKIKNIEQRGVYLIPETFRYYPAGELASHVIGFVGSDGNKYKGRYGIERTWEDDLEGRQGHISQERDAAGRWISIVDRMFAPAEDGTDLVLTIDHSVQYEVEKILRETVEKHGADQGTIIVMEPDTGKILAMASFPNFNPNEYSKVEDMAFFLNPAISLTYECGSVFKPFTMAMGLNEKKVEPETTYVDPGEIIEAGYSIKNSDEKVYGLQTMMQVLEESINTGVIHVERQVGNKKFAEYVKRLGFGEITNLDLPGEITGNINNLNYLNRDIEFYTAAFGQGITMTPLQLATAYAAIANGGTLMKPQIVEKKIYPNGEEEKISPQAVRKVVTKETSLKLGKMLQSVVENGHGKRAAIEGYEVGGKTGTAQVASKETKGYEEDLTIGSFAGYAPIRNPRAAILVKIDNPKGVQWAESTAAPAFSRVMKFVLEYYKVKPSS